MNTVSDETKAHPYLPGLAAESAERQVHALLAHALAEPWPTATTLLGEPVRLETLHLHGPSRPLPAGTPGAGDVVLVLTTPGPGHAQLILPGGLVRGLVALLTDGDAGPLVPASPAEAGLLSGLVSAVLKEHATALQLQDVALPGADAPGDVALLDAELTAVFNLAVGPHRGAVTVLLDGPAALELRKVAREAPPPGVDAAKIPVLAHFVLCTARLGWSEVLSLEPGDAVIFEARPAPAGDWDGWLRIGTHDYPAVARVTDQGRELEIRGEPMETHDEAPAPDLPPTGDLLDRLPVTLSVSLGTVELTAAAVARLQPGAVIALDKPIGDPVTVHAGSRRIATGELVEVDGAIGVRLLDLQL